MLDLEYAQITDRGRTRDHNEDYIGCVIPQSREQVRSHGWLFALADGVGGHDLGEVASRMAVESVVEGFRAAPGGESLSDLLPRLVRRANGRIFEAGLSASPGGSRMATTLAICALRFDRAAVAHVGDSRCYLIRHGQASLLTRDHTLANEQVSLGVISAGEARGLDTRHILSRSVGSELMVNPDTSEHLLLGGDLLVLCSDGLHNAVSGSDMARAFGVASDLQAGAQNLVDLANERDGGDNISVQVVRARSVERVGMYRGRPYRLS